MLPRSSVVASNVLSGAPIRKRSFEHRDCGSCSVCPMKVVLYACLYNGASRGCADGSHLTVSGGWRSP